MKSKVAEVVLKDFSGAASSFFGNVRVPGSIVMGSSLGALFALGKFSSSSNRERLPIEFLLIKVYRILSWISFFLSLNVVVASTVSWTKALRGDFDPMAESGHAFLQREFTFEYTMVQWSLLHALLLFIIIVTIRLLLEFELLVDPDRQDTGKFVILSSLGLFAHLVTFIESTLNTSLLSMTMELIGNLYSCWGKGLRPLEILSMFAFVGSAYYGVKSALGNNTSKNKQD